MADHAVTHTKLTRRASATEDACVRYGPVALSEPADVSDIAHRCRNHRFAILDQKHSM